MSPADFRWRFGAWVFHGYFGETGKDRLPGQMPEFVLSRARWSEADQCWSPNHCSERLSPWNKDFGPTLQAICYEVDRERRDPSCISAFLHATDARQIEAAGVEVRAMIRQLDRMVGQKVLKIKMKIGLTPRSAMKIIEP